MKESTRVVVALVAAVGGGIIIGATANDAALRAADAIAPLGALWVNAIRMTVIPLIVSLLVTGVASATDVTAIGRIGGRTFVVFGLLLVVEAVVIVPLAPGLFSLLPFPTNLGVLPALPAGAAEAATQVAQGSQTQTFGRWLTSLVPSNPIAAAANGDMIGLIVFTLLLALAVVRISTDSRDAIVGFFQSLGDAMLVMVRWVVLLAPIGVFALVLPLTAHLGASVAGAIGLYVAAYSTV
ncbi:MAG TPA: cation:dicarboxylase symporter family transporter, partial [Gemmatimonadaceae bacterium]|nr:cation:dicarboxylase symporter family transporter [Gemmatimonadaceae bacterium]